MAPAALLAAASLAAAAAAIDAEKTPIRLAYQSVYWAVPPYVAKREGYFDALGLDVSMVEYPSGNPMIEDKDAWDVGSAGAVPAIVGASSNIVVGITNDESAANALVGPYESAAWPPESLDASTTIALTPRSTGELAVQKCLANEGFDLDAPTYIEGQPSDVLGDLASGAAAYGGLWAPNTYAYLEGATAGETRSVLCTGADAGVAIPGAIFVNKDFGAEQPEVVAKLLTGWLRGIEFVKDPANEEAYLNYSREFYAEHGKTVSEESMRTDLATRPLFGLDDQVNILWGNALEWFDVVARFLGDTGQLDPVPEPDEYITPKFLEMVQADEMLGAYARGEDVVLDIESSSNDIPKDSVTKIDFLFPIVPGVASTLADTMASMVDEFNAEQPNIEVNAIYAGSYGDTYSKVIERRIEAGNPPAVAVLNVNRMVELEAMDAIVPLDEYINEAGGRAFFDQFFLPMFSSEVLATEDLEASPVDLMGFPMMRSTPVLYYNKDMLDAAGVTTPANWEQLLSAAAELTTSSVKGLAIPDTWTDWIYGAFSRQAGTQLVEDSDRTTVTFDSAGNTQALETWESLAKNGSIPVPFTSWSTAISDFNSGDKFAMLLYTTGGISAVKAGATFDWSCVYCPAGPEGFGVEQGGGDFHIFSGVPKAQQDAAWELIEFLTNPKNAALWSVASGYIAVNKLSYETDILRAAIAETPQYVTARDQLEFGHPQMMSLNIDNVRDVVKTNLGAVVEGTKSVEQAQIDGQAGMTEAITAAPVTEQPEPPSSASSSVGCALNIVLQVALLVTACVLLLGSSVDGAAAPVDLFPECKEWAERGDCKPGGRPYFMQKNCPESCHKATHREPETRHIADDQEAFYELSAKTANGKVFAMENTEGYVTVLVNAARVCDYSEVFYSTLEHMHSVHPYALEVLAFPFEHSAIDIEPCREAIESVEKEGDAKTKIHIMEAVKINGPGTHPIYQYLKKLFDIEEDEMDPNFSHYFFIDPDGTLIELHYGASYETLKTFVDFHVKHDLGEEERWEL